MTVKELKEILAGCDDNCEVIMYVESCKFPAYGAYQKHQDGENLLFISETTLEGQQKDEDEIDNFIRSKLK